MSQSSPTPSDYQVVVNRRLHDLFNTHNYQHLAPLLHVYDEDNYGECGYIYLCNGCGKTKEVHIHE